MSDASVDSNLFEDSDEQQKEVTLLPSPDYIASEDFLEFKRKK